MNNKNQISLEQEIKSNSEDKNQEEEMEEELEEELESKVEKPKKKKKNKKLPKDGLLSLKRKRPFNEEFEEDQNLFKPEVRFDEKSQTKEKVWEFKNAYLPRDKINIQKSIIKHIECTLGATTFDVNSYYLFQGTELSVRDMLLEQWNDTQLFIKKNNPKKFIICQ